MGPRKGFDRWTVAVVLLFAAAVVFDIWLRVDCARSSCGPGKTAVMMRTSGFGTACACVETAR